MFVSNRRLAWFAALFLGTSVGCNAQITGSGSQGGSNDCVGCPSGTGGSGANTGVDPGQPPGVEGVGWITRFPRLSHAQYENTVRDLLRLDAAPGLASSFAQDPDDVAFDTYVVRTVSANHWTDYQRAAEELAAEVTSNPTLLDRIRPVSAPTDPAAFVREFGRRAYRRALTQAEVDSYVTLFNQAPEMFEDGDAYSRGVELVLRAFLQSPHFLYRVESSTVAEGERVWLSNDEIATRLSYSLWNTMPSEELFAAADRGELSTAEGVRTWTSTMLGDPRAEDTIVSFHEQLFHIDGYGSIVKNATLFPTFTTELAPTLQEEARLFIRDVAVGLDGGIQSLLTEPVTYVNQSTAPFYGLAGTFGPEMQRVDLDPTRRAGILTQLGFLSRYGSQTQSDPILRGVHISLDFMCAELAPPPNGVPPLPPLADGQTNRERVEQSTSVAPCSGCHETYINPLGFAFENYDAIGQWRDTDNGLPVNAADTYVLDGAEVSYNNAVELSALLGQSETIHDCYSSRVLEYVLGRAPSVEEQNSVARLATVSLDSDSLRTLLAEVTTLDTFRARPPDSL